jgi:hypothetical protein
VDTSKNSKEWTLDTRPHFHKSRSGIFLTKFPNNHAEAVLRFDSNIQLLTHGAELLCRDLNIAITYLGGRFGAVTTQVSAGLEAPPKIFPSITPSLPSRTLAPPEWPPNGHLTIDLAIWRSSTASYAVAARCTEGPVTI